jgi:uncharacterized membrane protein
MKKILLVVALFMGLGSSAAIASVLVTSNVLTSPQVPQTPQTEEFVKIDSTEIPALVMNALAKDHVGATIKEAFVGQKDGVKIYKIVLTKEAEEITVLLNEKGEEVKLLN